MVMRLYNTFWEKEFRRNSIFSFALAIFFLLAEFYLILFSFDYTSNSIPFGLLYVLKLEFNAIIYYPMLALFHLLAITVFYFFFMIFLAYMRELLKVSSAGLVDFVVSLVIIWAFFLLIHGIWLSIVALALMSLVLLLFYFITSED